MVWHIAANMSIYQQADEHKGKEHKHMNTYGAAIDIYHNIIKILKVTNIIDRQRCTGGERRKKKQRKGKRNLLERETNFVFLENSTFSLRCTNFLAYTNAQTLLVSDKNLSWLSCSLLINTAISTNIPSATNI